METVTSFKIAGMPRIQFGAATFGELHKHIRAYGKHALIITGGESLKKSGKLDLLLEQLKESKVTVLTESIKGEPSPIMIDRIIRDFGREAINVVVSIGGGSVIDCGKAVSAMLAESGSVKDYLEGVGSRTPSGDKAPFIAVPTTSGTGTEAAKNAVISDLDEGYKKSLRHDNYVPDLALVDPELTLSSPWELTAACGFDAITQLIESYTSTKSNTFTDSLALKALSLAAESFLPVCIDNSDNIEFRSRMSYAALISGITLTHAGLGTVHGIAGPLGGIIPVPHGVACGKLLLPVMSFVLKKVLEEKNLAAQKRFADIGRLFTDEKEKEDAYYCGLFLGVIRNWTEILQLPALSSYGLTDEKIETVVRLSDNKTGPALLTQDEMRTVLETVR